MSRPPDPQPALSATRRLQAVSRTLSPISFASYSVFGPLTPVVPSRASWPPPLYPQEGWEPVRPEATTEFIKFQCSTTGTEVFTLDRPRALNALSWDMMLTLCRKADEWMQDPKVKLVVGLGEGKSFASGGDIKAVVDFIRNGRSCDGMSIIADSFRLNWKFSLLGKPYVCFIDGYTMGGGAGLALSADIRIATRRTVYASPETKFGYSPDFGGSFFIGQLDGQIGTWLAVTGQDVYGRAAFELGIASHYVAEEAVSEIVGRLKQLENPTTEEVSRIVSEFHVAGNDRPTGKDNPDGRSRIRGEIRRLLDDAFALPSIAEVYARLAESESDTALALETRAWAAEQRGMMDSRGPTGMAVALHNYHAAKAARRYATTLENDILMATGFGGAYRASNDLVVGAVHQLFDKKPPPTPFTPGITEVDHASLTPEAIATTFFTRNSPCLRDAPPMDKGNGLYPAPGPKDRQWGHFRQYGVPSEEAVRLAADGMSEETMACRILGNETGARRREFEAVIGRIVRDNCVRDGAGRLYWQGTGDSPMGDHHAVKVR